MVVQWITYIKSNLVMVSLSHFIIHSSKRITFCAMDKELNISFKLQLQILMNKDRVCRPMKGNVQKNSFQNYFHYSTALQTHNLIFHNIEYNIERPALRIYISMLQQTKYILSFNSFLFLIKSWLDRLNEVGRLILFYFYKLDYRRYI